jgi:hypothetical protein
MTKCIIAAAAVLSALVGGTQPSAAAQGQIVGAAPSLAGGPAHVFIYRNFRTGGPLNDPVVYIDGQPTGVSAMGSVFERDVPPGTYVFTTDPKHPELAEITSVLTQPGSAVYLAVDDNWVDDDTQGSRTLVFSIAPIDPAIALPQVARLPLERGRQ